MADNKQDVGKPDRDRVDKDDLSEVRRVAAEHDTSTAAVRDVIDKVGPMRADIERELVRRSGKQS